MHTSSGGQTPASNEANVLYFSKLLSDALGVTSDEDDVQLSSTSLTAITTEQSAALAEMTKEDQ